MFNIEVPQLPLTDSIFVILKSDAWIIEISDTIVGSE
jgi:hypothetical protein